MSELIGILNRFAVLSINAQQIYLIRPKALEV